MWSIVFRFRLKHRGVFGVLASLIPSLSWSSSSEPDCSSESPESSNLNLALDAAALSLGATSISPTASDMSLPDKSPPEASESLQGFFFFSPFFFGDALSFLLRDVFKLLSPAI